MGSGVTNKDAGLGLTKDDVSQKCEVEVTVWIVDMLVHSVQ